MRFISKYLLSSAFAIFLPQVYGPCSDVQLYIPRYKPCYIYCQEYYEYHHYIGPCSSTHIKNDDLECFCTPSEKNGEHSLRVLMPSDEVICVTLEECKIIYPSVSYYMRNREIKASI